MNSKRKSIDASDPQAQKCYDWQHSWLDWNRKVSTLDECRAIIQNVCKAYDMPLPTVTSAPAKRWHSVYLPEEHRVELVPDHQNAPVALHEATHAVIAYCYPRSQDHGPTFTGIVLDLLVQHGVAPAEAIYASARKAGMKWRKWKHPKKKAR
jgi:hypothetical protein